MKQTVNAQRLMPNSEETLSSDVERWTLRVGRFLSRL